MPLAAQVSFRTGDGGLDRTLSSLNVDARANLGPFLADLSASFGVPLPQIQGWIDVEKLEPAEVYLTLEMGRAANVPPAQVIEARRKHQGRGWGAVAKDLGIKPGSPAFKALKDDTGKQAEKAKGRKR